jgi:two-component system phosphate regulon sensor histidine kinase PhoR
MPMPLSEEKLQEIVTRFENDNNFKLISAYIDDLDSLQQENEFYQNQKQFVSMLTHQLKTPVSSLLWTIETMRKTAANREAMDDLRVKTENIADIVKNLSYLLEIGTYKPGVQSTFLLHAQIKEIIKSLKEKATRKKIRIVCKALTKQSIVGDKDAFTYAIRTIIDNAVTYNKPNGKVEIVCRKKNGNIQLLVKDTGYGIPKKEQDKIFTNFFRASNASLGKNEGSGVNLFIAKQIFESHGGKIGFSSIEGKGSTFWIKCSCGATNKTNK